MCIGDLVLYLEGFKASTEVNLDYLGRRLSYLYFSLAEKANCAPAVRLAGLATLCG